MLPRSIAAAHLAFRISGPARFTMLVFDRGLHCPAGQAQLRELERRLDALQERGLAVVSISAETEARATRMRDEWGVRRVRSPTD